MDELVYLKKKKKKKEEGKKKRHHSCCSDCRFPRGPARLMNRKRHWNYFVAFVVAAIQMSRSTRCSSAQLQQRQKRELLLTRHSAQSERFDAVQFHIGGQVEVLSGVLVDLKDKCTGGKRREQRL